MKEIKDLKLKALKDLNAMEVADLKKELVSAKKTIFELNMKLELNELKQTHLIKALRIQITRPRHTTITISNSKVLDILPLHNL